jgi:CheY-like chemotaxis protein
MTCVLVAEDDAATRMALVALLQANGYDTLAVSNGRVALDRLRAGERPCLVLLDLMMPVMTGWQFLAERQKDPALAAVPVVVFTAASGYDDSMLRGMGADGVIRKPADAEQLLRAVTRCCQARQAGGAGGTPAPAAPLLSLLVLLAMPLLALLASVPPAAAGPPEGPSGRMAFDEVAEGLRRYRLEADPARRRAWLRRLAPAGDARVALELWEVFAWVRGRRTAATRAVARDCLAERYATRDGRPLAEVAQSEADRGAGVCSWWSQNGPDLRHRASELPR